MRGRIPVALLLGGLLACGGGGSKGEDAKGAEGTASAGGPDPCTLVSESEMAAILGPLGERPYRIDSDRRTDPAGSDCMYRARDGHNIALSVDWEDGELLMRMSGATAGGQSAAYRILRSSTGYDFGQSWTIPAGWPGLQDTPVPADYDGDGDLDFAVGSHSIGAPPTGTQWVDIWWNQARSPAAPRGR